jgi:hypothetical protein
MQVLCRSVVARCVSCVGSHLIRRPRLWTAPGSSPPPPPPHSCGPLCISPLLPCQSLEELTVVQLINRVEAFHESEGFILVFTALERGAFTSRHSLSFIEDPS